MGNSGFITINDVVALTNSLKLNEDIYIFLQRGENISERIDPIRNLKVYTLNHPDFTEPNGTEYILCAIRLESGDEYICGLRAFRDGEFVTIKEYENPYAYKATL